jgi:hypothetical protein
VLFPQSPPDRFRRDEFVGSAKHFTLNVTIEGVDTTGPATAGNYRVQLNDARFFTNAALTTGAANQDLVPAQYYRTDYKTAVHD